MPFIQQGAFSFLHANQPDNLSAILTADQIKNKFDSQALELKTSLNNLIIALGSTVLGDSGAKNIGTGAISGVTGATVQDMLINLKSQIDANSLLNGGNVTGNLTVSGIVQGNNSIRSDSAVAGQTTLVLKNSADDAYLRYFTTTTNNYLASSNYASTASKNLLITGYSGNNMTTLTLKADTTIMSLLTTTGITSTGAISINGNLITTSGVSNQNVIIGASVGGVYLRPNGSGSTTGEFSVATSGTASINGNAIISGTISEGGTLLSSKYLPLATGGTIQGAVIVNSTFGANSNISEGGVRLDAKYAQLNVQNTFVGQQNITGALVISDTTPTLNVISTTNDAKVRVAFTSTINYIQSGVNSTSGAKNLTICGMNASTMSVCNIGAVTLQENGVPVITENNLQAGKVTITPVANTPTSVNVTFSPAYPTAPIVTATAVSAVPGTQVTGVAVSNITTTGCAIYVTRTNTNPTDVNWIAIGT